MFLIDNSIPFRNGIVVQGRFTVNHPEIQPGDMFIAERDGVRVGIVRFIGILSANFTQSKENPRYHVSVAFDGDYRVLAGATLTKFKA